MASVYISERGLAAIMWVGIVLSIIFVALRTQVQFHNTGRFFINDYWIFFAIVCHIATAIVYQIAIPPMYDVQYFDYATQPMDAAFMGRASLFLRLQFALDFLLWTTLWAVKFSLLFFFWRLFDSVRTPVRVFWWTMCAITASTWITLVVLQNFACDPIKNFFTLGKCSSARDIYYSNLVFKFTVGTDIAGDILIMLIPFPLLRTLHVAPRQKYILAAIFSLPIIPIIFAVLRLVIANPSTGNVDPIKFQLYSMLENSSAIVTSCLPSLRLFVGNNSRAQTGYKGSSHKSRYGREYSSGQGDYFRHRVHGSGVGSSEARVQAQSYRMETFEIETQSGSKVMEEDTGTEKSDSSQRGIVQAPKGVFVTREFMVR
ncbi:hypothetical protein BJY01DRAFT_263773 [Aspergillus pseudoustus]|uniref:Rhodopsin domain-containing protein n=1 Tax=Aspergillus pseudoustus TaxID=1810923 RepID=A0ABR4JYE4_9EURO